MSDTNPTELLPREELSDILFVLDKMRMKIQAVTGLGDDGTLKTVNPTRKNQNQFMKVDKSGDVFSNFFSNFFSQLRNPTRFSFFKVPQLLAVDVAGKLQKHLTHPTEEGEKLMEQYAVKTETSKDIKQENTTNMEETSKQTGSSEYRYQVEQIDWETLSNLGLNKDRLEKLNVLEPLLKGYKTNELIPISINLGTAITRIDARLSLQPDDHGQIVMAIHGIRKEPQLHYPFFGHEFTKEDKENLLSTGNMGRVVELTNLKTGESTPSVISVDRLTNELIALKTEYIKIPEEIKGVALDETQKQTLREGKPLHLEGMISKKGEPFEATVQYNADKRYVEFLFDRTDHSQKNRIHPEYNSQNPLQELPQTFRGKELNEEQYSQLKDGQTVYVSGLMDKKGVAYNGYVAVNQETGGLEFSFQDSDKLKGQLKPTGAHRTQTAVHSDGNTNEATKNIKEPLKSGQKETRHENELKQQDPLNTPVKSRGKKL